MCEEERFEPEEAEARWTEPEEETNEPAAEPPFAPAYQPAAADNAIISNNMTVNLICTLAAMSGALGLFFYFADKRSQAVRRFAVQSTALLFVYVVGATLCFLLGIVLGMVPLLGGVFRAGVNGAWLLLTLAGVAGRVRMMLHAYAGRAYVLPVIGAQARAFE